MDKKCLVLPKRKHEKHDITLTTTRLTSSYSNYKDYYTIMTLLLYNCVPDLGVIQLGQSRAGVSQQEVAAQDGHLVSKLHVLQWAVGNRALLQVDDAPVHQEGRVDQLSDFC